MATYKFDHDTDTLVPADQWHEQQAQRHQKYQPEHQLERYIEPSPKSVDILPPAPLYQPDESLGAPLGYESKEASTPIERSKSFVIRYSAIAVVLLLLSLGVVWIAVGAVQLNYILALFGLLAVIAFVVLTKSDYQHSTYGNERHRITQLSTLLDNESARIHQRQMEQIQLDHEFRMNSMRG